MSQQGFQNAVFNNLASSEKFAGLLADLYLKKEKSKKLLPKEKVIWEKNFIKITEKHEKVFEKALVAYFKKQEKAVLGRVSSYAVKALDFKKWKKFVEEQVESLYKLGLEGLYPPFEEMAAFTTGVVETLMPTLEFSFDMLNPEVVKALEGASNSFSASVTDTTFTQIKAALLAGVEGGETFRELSDRVKHVYEGATGSRAMMIARTEVIRACNAGAVEVYRQSGVVGGKQWLCIPAGERIYTANRGSVKIEEMEDGDVVWSLGSKGAERQKVVGRYKQGEKEIFEIKTGRKTIRVSENHPFLVLECTHNGRGGRGCNTGELVWREAKKIKVEDYVVVVSSLELGEESGKEDLCKLIGFWLGDGCYDGGRINLAIPEWRQDLEEEYKRICLNLFGEMGVKFERVGKYNVELKKEVKTYSMRKTPRGYMELLGVKGRSGDKRVPSWVFTSGRNAVRSLIKGFGDADGSVDKRGRLTLMSTNFEMLKDLASLVDYLGVRRSNVGFGKREKINYKDYYRFTISNAGLIGSDCNSDNKRIEENMLRGKVEKVNFKSRLGRIVEMVPKGFSIDRVKKITVKGKEVVYDLEIENRHNFICEGFVVHNSTHDDRTCAACMALDGKIIELDSVFLADGDEFEAGSGDGKVVIQNTYGDIGAPGLHPGCRCTVVPVLMEGYKSYEKTWSRSAVLASIEARRKKREASKKSRVSINVDGRTEEQMKKMGFVKEDFLPFVEAGVGMDGDCRLISYGDKAGEWSLNGEVNWYKGGTSEHEGSFQFTIDKRESDMHFDLVEFYSANAMGKGIGRKLVEEAEKLCKKRGIKEISLLANISVGRYAWAKLGFDFADEDVGRRVAGLEVYIHGVLKANKINISDEGVKRLWDKTAGIKSAADMANFKISGLEFSKGGLVKTSLFDNREVGDSVKMDIGKAFMLDYNGLGSWHGVKKVK